MFSQLEHEALMRLMTHATGYTPDSRRIAHWLQEWEQADNPRTAKSHVPGLAASHALDVAKVAHAAKRDGARPTTLGCQATPGIDPLATSGTDPRRGLMTG